MRVVTLIPSATEIVAFLGLGDLLVGVSHECDFPPEVAELPRLTRTTLEVGISPAQIDAAVRSAMLEGRPLYAVDAEQLAALDPDLIVTQGVCSVCAVSEGQLLPLQSRTRSRLVSLRGSDFAGVLDDVRAVGEATDRSEVAAARVAELRARWDAGASPDPAGPRVLFAEWPDPLWVGGHWVPEQILAAGGRCSFAEPGAPSRRIEWDAALADDPDVVVFGSCGFDLARNVEAAKATLPRLARARVYAIDANAFTSRPAPRLVRGMELLKAMVRDEAADVDTSEASCLRGGW